jgi:hypothetical protein
MMDLPVDFRELLEELARGAVEAVLVGGYAVAFHGRPRATKDIDPAAASARRRTSCEPWPRSRTTRSRFGVSRRFVAEYLERVRGAGK